MDFSSQSKPQNPKTPKPRGCLIWNLDWNFEIELLNLCKIFNINLTKLSEVFSNFMKNLKLQRWQAKWSAFSLQIVKGNVQFLVKHLNISRALVIKLSSLPIKRHLATTDRLLTHMKEHLRQVIDLQSGKWRDSGQSVRPEFLAGLLEVEFLSKRLVLSSELRMMP